MRVDPLWLQGVYGLVILAAIGDRRLGLAQRRGAAAVGEATGMTAARDGRAPAGRSLEPAPRGADARGLRLRRGGGARTFSRAFNLSQPAAGVAEKALLVLPMVLLIIAREIDLSVA